MKPIWEQTTNPDVLTHVQQLKDEITAWEERYSKLSNNYNGLSKKHATALEEIKRLNVIAINEKSLKKAIGHANTKIKGLRDSNKHLRERLG